MAYAIGIVDSKQLQLCQHQFTNLKDLTIDEVEDTQKLYEALSDLHAKQLQKMTLILYARTFSAEYLSKLVDKFQVNSLVIKPNSHYSSYKLEVSCLDQNFAPSVRVLELHEANEECRTINKYEFLKLFPNLVHLVIRTHEKTRIKMKRK